MHLPGFRTRLALTVVAAASALAGCGEGAAEPPRRRRAASNELQRLRRGRQADFEQCASAMEHAVAGHEKAAPNTLAQVLREDRGRGAVRAHRVRRLSPASSGVPRHRRHVSDGAPLYAAPEGKEGFRAADKALFLVSDETLTFSEHAQTLAEGGAEAKKKR